MLSQFLERNPHYGILASMSGIGTFILGVLHYVNPVLETLAALFGLGAGIYTFLIKRHHWKREKNKH